MALQDQPIDEPLRQWNLARAAFAASLQEYLAALSCFELVCPNFFASKELDATRPDVRATLDEEILSLATVKSLVSPTTTRLLRLKNMSAVISPIRTLPPELVAQVFISAVDSYRTFNAGSDQRLMSVKQVNSISRVCSDWRRIALDTRRLWSFIDFENSNNSSRLRLWVERADGYPLDVKNTVRFSCRDAEEAHNVRFSRMLPHINYIRSMALRSGPGSMKEWISEWYKNGISHTLTTLALCAPSWVEFPPQGEAINQQRLTELLHSLDTLYLSELRVNWESLACQNLVTLGLVAVQISADTLRDILAANPNLQDIQLLDLVVSYTSTAASLPPVELHYLHTLRVEGNKSCQLLPTIAPRNHELTLKIIDRSLHSSDDTSKRDLASFLRRSHITKLLCRSRLVLEHVITAECKLTVLCFENMDLDHSIYNLIVPPVDADSTSPPGNLHSRLPHLHSIYIATGVVKYPGGFRRVLSACPIREVGIDHFCSTKNGKMFEVDDLKRWVGPGIDVSFVMRKKEKRYAPCGNS